MTTPVCPSYAGYRFPAEVISHAVWLYFRFPLGLRMIEEMLAARGIIVSYESVRQWALKFGQAFANQIRPTSFVHRHTGALAPQLLYPGPDHGEIVGCARLGYDNAIAETVISLFKTAMIRRCNPWRGLEAVEFAILEWVD